MYIEAVPNRNSPPAILLRESYRHEGKVRKRTLCNLSDWSPAHVEGLRGVLKGGTVIAAEHDAFTVTRSLPHGHVAAALGTARKIGLDRLCCMDMRRDGAGTQFPQPNMLFKRYGHSSGVRAPASGSWPQQQWQPRSPRSGRCAIEAHRR
jgi:hypothetical protein